MPLSSKMTFCDLLRMLSRACRLRPVKGLTSANESCLAANLKAVSGGFGSPPLRTSCSCCCTNCKLACGRWIRSGLLIRYFSLSVTDGSLFCISCKLLLLLEIRALFFKDVLFWAFIYAISSSSYGFDLLA